MIKSGLILLSRTLQVICKLIFRRKPIACLLATPTHANLGDQAQLYCIELWLNRYYPNHRIIRIPDEIGSPGIPPYYHVLTPAILSTAIMLTIKLFRRKGDLFFGHSGYFLTDHHRGWAVFARFLILNPRSRLVIFPQTINFFNPVIRERVARLFDDRGEVTLLCRDKISFENAQKMFSRSHLLLYPDIVTSLIGKMHYSFPRTGILFCIRNDSESLYSMDAIESLRTKFNRIPTELSDTTISLSFNELDKFRKKIIQETVERFAHFKLVITDRYHGTIFSLIANTPVIVISSNDHKLSSGVDWFSEKYRKHITFAASLDEAYEKGMEILNRPESDQSLPPYFEEEYYSKLANILP
ncbi:polysaccharide pyruvyl transferase family protein [Victivallis vadensis]|uniref:polysaccharide pyruvyl transferase family protein n=1 Tax=Victivallis vadensis TaxID=172901 RepID=UPI0023F58A66|nr:polysaccharide pyruvyl transferase family protein [Victivallis vadensis]